LLADSLPEADECLEAGDAIDLEAARRLEPPYRPLGPRAIQPVDTHWVVARLGQEALQITHQSRAARPITRAGIQRRPRRVERRERVGTDDTVDRQAGGRLKPRDGRLGARTVQTVHGPWRKAGERKAVLQAPHQR
jgi:hypothetical protein